MLAALKEQLNQLITLFMIKKKPGPKALAFSTKSFLEY